MSPTTSTTENKGARAPGLSDDQRWSAVRARDQRFDGTFIVGVRTTGIYCRPSCPTPVQPLRKNVNFFRTTAAAQRAGLRACKRCRPDASPGSPEWNLRDDLVGRAMRAITNGQLNEGTVATLASDLGVTERHLRRMMIDAVGAPPLAIARAHRAQTARTLIETTSLPFTDVAFAAGFQSLRQFNDTIRQVFASTPTELRRKRAANDGAAPGELMLRLPYRAPLDVSALIGWHERRAIPQMMRCHEGQISIALRLPNGSGVAHLRDAPDNDWINVGLELDAVGDLAAAVRQCRRLLDLDADPLQIDTALGALAELAPLVAARPGRRSPGSTDGFATLIFAILGQQRSVAAARTIATRLFDRAGQLDDTLQPFPAPELVAELDLDGLGLTHRNMATIHDAAAFVASAGEPLSPISDRDAVRAGLLEIKGIGPWTADYVAMRALAAPDIWLGGDLVAARAGQALNLDEARIEAARPWRSYLTHHLWAASGDLNPSKET